MQDVFKASVEELLTVTASDNPTPGGGSVAAIVGALGIALVQMVGNLTVGKEKYRNVEGEIKQLIQKCSTLMEKLKKLAEEDMSHFHTFIKVLGMPKDTPEELATRKEKIQVALKEATKTPLAIATYGVEVLSLANRMAAVGTKMAISDTGVAAHLAEATVQAALITAESNFARIKDQEFLNWAQAEKQRLSKEAQDLKEKTLHHMNERI
jgi:formiminotetrahydrofolate cyclodeaminase